MIKYFDFSKSLELKNFKPGLKIKVKDKMQKNYSYTLSARYGKDFDEGFKPELTPSEMLKLGVFEGHYLNDCYKELPKNWYKDALKKLSPEKPNIDLNCFKIKSRQSLQEWIRKGWIKKNDPDVRGWFQWYCRYYIGRRNELLDGRQIKRWRQFNRHRGQILKNCTKKDLTCRPRQRQALLQWSYDPFI
jgi:hypothetical protein